MNGSGQSPLGDSQGARLEAEELSYLSWGDFPRLQANALHEFKGFEGAAFISTDQERKYLRYAPEFVDDPDGTGYFTRVKAATYPSPAAQIAIVSNPYIVGYRTLITKGKFFNDAVILGQQEIDFYLDRFNGLGAFPNEDSGIRRIPETNRFRISVGKRVFRTIKGTTLVLCSQEPSNYGSFIFRVLPKLAGLDTTKLHEDSVLAYARSPGTQRLLKLCGIPTDRVIQHDTNTITQLERAIVPSLRNPNGFLDEETRKFYAAMRANFGSRTRGRFLYISRFRHGNSGASPRVMQNEGDLIERLKQIGFDIVEPESLSADEQIQTFSSADMVVGPAGSGMFNCVFCHPGTKLIDIESEPHWIHTHAGLFSSCELRYGIFVGKQDSDDPSPAHKRWNVNIEQLIARINDFRRQ